MVTVADIVRGEGKPFVETHFVTPVQRKAMHDITACRTAAMGTLRQTCECCSADYQLFRSCRNRSCPSCGGAARKKWLEARRQEILPVEYLQVVFTTPAELNVLARYCPRALYAAAMRAAGQAIMDVGWSKLHLQLGCLAQLHTWAQSMAFHLHVHFVVPCGGFSEDGTQWVSFQPGDLPAKTLANRFRSLLCKAVRAAAQQGQLDNLPSTVSVEQLLARVENRQWNVYAEPPFEGVQTFLKYLSRYTYRVAITNDRILSYEDHQVTFRCRDSRHRDKEQRYTFAGVEFVRRLMMHVPPKGFVRSRSYGFLGNRGRKAHLDQARKLIGQAEPAPSPEPSQPLRLCPACFERWGKGRRPHFAPAPELASPLPFNPRPPPNRSVAA